MAEIVTKKIRCLTVGCNPKMVAKGVEGTFIKNWEGNAAFVKHSEEHPTHRIAKAPERSAAGIRKQEIYSDTGIYPTNLTAYLAEQAAAAEKKAKEKAEWDAAKPERIAKAEAERLAGIERRRKAAILKQELHEKAKIARIALIAKISNWGLDEEFLQSCINDPQQGSGLFNAIESLNKYGETIRREQGGKYFNIFQNLQKEFLKEENWKREVKRKTYEVQGYYTEAEMAQRLEFIKQWEELCEKGENEGWLDWTNDYSGSHLYAVNSNQHPTRKEKKLENVGDYAERLKKRVVTIHNKIASEFKSAEKARQIVKRFES